MIDDRHGRQIVFAIDDRPRAGKRGIKMIVRDALVIHRGGNLQGIDPIAAEIALDIHRGGKLQGIDPIAAEIALDIHRGGNLQGIDPIAAEIRTIRHVRWFQRVDENAFERLYEHFHDAHFRAVRSTRGRPRPAPLTAVIISGN